jgi:hypothetical protein
MFTFKLEFEDGTHTAAVPNWRPGDTTPSAAQRPIGSCRRPPGVTRVF